MDPGSPDAAEDWRSYRCPVCGHVDEVASPDRESLLIRCSHCDTALRVERDGEGAERLSVRVATDEPDGEES